MQEDLRNLVQACVLRDILDGTSGGMCYGDKSAGCPDVARNPSCCKLAPSRIEDLGANIEV